jgi:hypothetical protein
MNTIILRHYIETVKNSIWKKMCKYSYQPIIYNTNIKHVSQLIAVWFRVLPLNLLAPISEIYACVFRRCDDLQFINTPTKTVFRSS